MTWVELIGLSISAIRSLLSMLTPHLNSKYGDTAQEVYNLIEAGLSSLEQARGKALDLAQLESLRTERQW